MFLFVYFIQHCFICHPSGSTVSEDAVIEPRTVATSALAVRRFSHSAISHPHSARSHPTRLHLIHTRLDLINLATSHPHSATSHPILLLYITKLEALRELENLGVQDLGNKRHAQFLARCVRKKRRSL